MIAVLLMALLLPACTAAGQDRAAQIEQELYAATREGMAPARLLPLCRRAVELLPERPYPRLVMGDTLFELRRLRAAVGAYDRALALLAKEGGQGPLGESARRNREEAAAQLARIERGVALASRARWSGRVLLLLLLGSVLWFAFRGPGGDQQKRSKPLRPLPRPSSTAR